jgi:thiaminase
MNTALKSSANVRQIGNAHVAIDYLGFSYELKGDSANIFLNILPALHRGDLSFQEITDQAKFGKNKVEKLLHLLGAHELISRNHDSHVKMSGLEFYQHHRKFCHHWLQEIYEHPFWDKVVQGTATDAQILGFAFEKYHYIEGAHEHMGIAAANSTKELMPHLAKHFCEEYTHGDIYRAGLAKLFDDDIVLNSQPLPSTRALVNFLNEAAAKNSLAYYAANEFLQMTENEDANNGIESVSNFYDKMTEHYPYTDPLVTAFIRHTKLDQHLKHENAFLEMCKDIPHLTMSEVQDIMDTTRSLVDVLKLFMDGIDVFYQYFPDIPRMPSTLLSD